ncbi:MAG: thioredoxin domain-containing protein [Anaerolineae bacterium]|nr:thioredoxin domain-containing protein [Anaerolineae bacterium]
MMAKSSRARTKERKQERQKQRQRNRQYLIIGAIVIAAVALVGLYALANLPSEAPLPDTLDRYAEIPQSVTNDGFPMLGDPSAPIEVVEYASFACVACKEFHQNSFDDLLARVEAGQVRFVYIPREIGTVPNAEGANRGAVCAGEQGKFWEMHDVLFHWHDVLGNSAFQGNRISTGAEEIGLNVDTFNSCFNSSRVSDLLTRARIDEISGTPSFKVNGADVEPRIQAILEAIDSLLETNISDTEPDAVDTEATAEVTEVVSEEATAEATESVDAEVTETVSEEATVEMTEVVSEEATAEATEASE